MKKALKITAVIILLISVLSPLTVCAEGSGSFSALIYPDEALTEFEPSKLDRISSGDDYTANRGYDETGLFVSPFWEMEVNEEKAPVYAALTYDWVLNRGVVQSFQYIFAESGAFPLRIKLSFGGEIHSACVLPQSLGAKAAVDENSVFFSVNGTGAYTVLINNDSQEYAVTVFVENERDENAEINRLKDENGAENVAVYEKGVYELSTLPTDKKAIYFKRGAFITAAHTADIRSDAEALSGVLPAFAAFDGKDGMTVTGCGTFDFTRLDRGERNLITVNFCRDSVFENLILLNPNSWSVTAYACENCRFNNITVFGYRTNSDGINICGCDGITVENSFCRNGDDCFSAKATNEYYECRNVTFNNCTGWSCKARCFGITGEVFRDISNITFQNCAVIFRNATWDNDRTASLAVSAETGGADIRDIVFKNIEIHRDTGRAILCLVYGEDISGCNMKNIVFENITCSCGEKLKFSTERKIGTLGRICSAAVRFLKRLGAEKSALFSPLIRVLEKQYNASNSMDVTLKNVAVNGKSVSHRDMIIEGNVRI